MVKKEGPKKISLTIYLLKKKTTAEADSYWKPSEFLAKNVDELGRSRSVKTVSHPVGENGSIGTLYVKSPPSSSVPEWIDFLSKHLINATALDKLKNKSVAAILVLNCQSRQFIISFGHGRFLIDARVIEERFGMRVALNSVSPEKISSIDRQTFDASPRISRTQTVKASSVADYIISPEQDLLKALVGEVKSVYKDLLGSVIAGADSLKTSVAIELTDINKLLALALERSESKDYLAQDKLGNDSAFAWVENLLPIKDEGLIEILDAKVLSDLNLNEFDGMWMAMPEILDWSEIAGFKYAGVKNDDLHATLDLQEFLVSLGDKPNLSMLRKRAISIVMTKGAPIKSFNAYRCIYAEKQYNSSQFILTDGKWYRVEKKFQNTVEEYFNKLPRRSFAMPFVEYDHSGEGSYNEYVCALAKDTHIMLDRKLIQFGGQYDKIELCDIFRSPDKAKKQGMQFIHVKRGRSSATLSHLFSQGLVAATLLVKESEFRKIIDTKFAEIKFPILSENFNGRGHEVIFAIIDGPRGSILDLPFFSKVTLHLCGKSIAAFGYDVGIMHIPESASHLTKKKLEKAVKKASKVASLTSRLI